MTWARKISPQELSDLHGEEFLARSKELGSNLSYWHLPSHRLMVIDDELEFAYTWCSHKNSWNLMDWDLVSELTDH